MLGINKEIENFSYIDIAALEEIHGRLDDQTRDSFKHYNKSLELVRSKSEDIAILEVKRAINLNPHFNEAQNLLGLLYALTGEEDKAVEVFKTVIAEEKNSIKALDYIGKIDGFAAASSLVFTDMDSTGISKRPEIKKKKATPEKEKIAKRNNAGILQNYIGSLKYHVIVYAVIFAVCALAFSSSPKKVSNVPSDNSEEVTKLNSTINQLTDINKALTDENNKLKEQVNNNNAQQQIVQNGEKLNEAENLASSRQYEQAVDLLLLLKDVQFNETDKNRYTKLLNDNVPKATWSVYVEGINFFSAQDYKNASVKLAKSISYGGSWQYTPDSYYNLGRAYQNLGDKQNALNTFNTLKTKYPNSESAINADYRINELNK